MTGIPPNEKVQVNLQTAERISAMPVLNPEE
jgi:hypothetical protein